MNTPQTWSSLGFEVEITGDGSPSLRLLQGTVYPDKISDKGESMHHSGGAAEETELIYGTVIRKTFAAERTPHFLSVGLGLGYVELSVAREALLKQNLNFSLESFELIPELKSFYVSWLKGEVLPKEIQTVYDQILSYILKPTEGQLDGAFIKSVLVEKLASGQWTLQAALDGNSVFVKPAHLILFDAFSAKTTPDIWTEEFLVDFFKKAAAPDSILSTYASRAGLKRALQQVGFVVETREGFKGKRNSTVAYRGVNAPPMVTSSGPAETSLRTR